MNIDSGMEQFLCKSQGITLNRTMCIFTAELYTENGQRIF